MIDKKDITGIILSGGKSSRMGNDKGFLLYDGKPFVQYSIDALKPLVSRIMIVSNNEDYDVFGLERIEDVIENAGPLAGIYSGLKQSSTTYNLVLSCDIPLISTEILKKLIDAVEGDYEVIQIKSQGKNMPLIALYKKSCEDVFLKLLKDGERRLQFAVNQCKVKNVILNNEEVFFTKNINTPEQLNDILK
ncbi:molybdenum cofactor guanylyltransferase [Mariniflexile litorale]|uniref:Probable molybdenum cofactor guanylyltransferase n=1 Tax=Mariniflexile litorale TaxID=3045158 RepID=A0AAU7EF57_9FLAO|nr:molybdenum cofactor guanylyltransferase [Mariniflexile sp. KMM 9835]MDQ8211842.1 molybdenum cofactor guanylyltransferase [Mariniflexile sp. KMM 9835]